MGYTKEEILIRCKDKIQNPATFYQQDFVNYRGKTTDTHELYTEVVAAFIIERINQFTTGIPMISRTRGYNANHDGSYSNDSNRVEEITAMKMFNQSRQGIHFDYIGSIIDYQTPLKAVRSDKAGKIDLLSYNGTEARVLELKKPDSEETMLRCVLEGYTYLRTLNTAKMLSDFGLPVETPVYASPFVFREGVQWQEWQEDRPMLKKLMKMLDSKPLFIVQYDKEYHITED